MMYVTSNASDVDLIEELESRGYMVTFEDPMIELATRDDIEKLYLDYQLTSPDFFEKQLKLFFQKYLNKYIR